MTLLPKIRTKYGEGIGVELFFSFPELQDDQRSYLDADVAAGLSSISADGANFGVGQFIVIGQPGNVRTEIIQIHTSTVPTGTTIALASALQFAHNRGDVIRFIPYDQITSERSTNSGTSYSALTAVAIRADSSETYLQRTGDASTDYYRFRFNNSITGLFSTYSDQTAASGFAANSIWAVKNRALNDLGEKRSELLNDQFLNDSIYEARRMTDFDPRVLRWTFRTKFNTSIGQAVSGHWSVASPSDLRDRNTFKNILGIRIGRQFRPMIYQDQMRFEQNYLNIAHSTLNGAVIFGATSIVLTSTADFDNSGTITVGGSGIGVLTTTITYTGNNRSTNTLSGVTGVPAAGFATLTDVWQNATFGLPSAYTINNAVVYFDLPFQTTIDGRNITMDYYSAIPVITSDAQLFDEPFYDHYVSWLKWKIKYKKSNGKIDRDKDPDFKDWMDGLTRIISQETNGQRINFVPDVDGFLTASY